MIKIERSKEWWVKRAMEEDEMEIGAGMTFGNPSLPDKEAVDEYKKIQQEYIETRKLATIRTVSALEPIEGADKIEVATIDGWSCVVGKGDFKPGDLCVYFEIDSFIPVGDDYPHFEFLRKRAIKWNGKDGCRIKTMKLRGQISQGLAMPLTSFDNLPLHFAINFGSYNPKEGDDVTAMLGIEKWEPVIPAQLSGKVKGNFPDGIPKTDQPRIQNMKRELNNLVRKISNPKFDITTKIDGTSMTVYLRANGEFGVASRNLELVRDENNSYWWHVIRNGLEEKFRSAVVEIGELKNGFAIQGELIGPGIQGNKEQLTETKWLIFEVIDISTGKKQSPSIIRYVANKLGLETVPLVGQIFFKEFCDENGVPVLDEFKKWADGPSYNPKVKREGVVFKCLEEPEFSFKVISEQWLLDNE